MTTRRLPRPRELAPLVRVRRPRLDPTRRRLDSAYTITDLRTVARRRTPRAVFDFVDGADACGDASQHKAPVGGPDTGPNYWDRGKQGWKWSLVTDTAGIPVGWTTAGANRPVASLLAPTLDDVARRGFLGIVERLHEAADRGLWAEPDAGVLAAMQQVYLDVEGDLEDREQ